MHMSSLVLVYIYKSIKKPDIVKFFIEKVNIFNSRSLQSPWVKKATGDYELNREASDFFHNTDVVRP
jgi:hypothetical protein